MHESTVYIYVTDQAYVATEAQKEKALLLFDLTITEVEHEPCIMEHAEFTVGNGETEHGIKISSPFVLTAGMLSGSNKYWLLDPDESADDADENDYDEIAYGTNLRPEVMQQLEDILGTKLQIAWQYD